MEKIIEANLGVNTDKPQENIRKIIQHVNRNIIGRIANTAGDVELDNLDILMKYVYLSAGGNYLEIGTLFGGSAIAVALLKKELGQTGIVICVDPLDGYYPQYAKRTDKIDGVSGKAVTPKVLFKNIDLFDVGDRILVMKAYSQLMPDLDIKFSVSYIDGDHKNGMPLQDWLKVKDITTRYVVFDNWGDQHPDVQIACKEANADPEWKCIYNKGITYVVAKSEKALEI
jgi:hypothetical protein